MKMHLLLLMVLQSGSVSEVIVDDAGTLYEEGDTVTFTSDSVDTDVSTATGFVSMVGGGIQLEDSSTDRLSIKKLQQYQGLFLLRFYLKIFKVISLLEMELHLSSLLLIPLQLQMT